MSRPASNKTLIKKCDAFWGKIVTAGGSCEVGGRSDLKVDPHHYIGRKNKRLRWDPRNGVRLCVTHHTWGNPCAHNDAEWFRTFMLENRKEDFEYLNRVKRELVKVNRAFLLDKLAELEEEAKSLGIDL